MGAMFVSPYSSWIKCAQVVRSLLNRARMFAHWQFLFILAVSSNLRTCSIYASLKKLHRNSEHCLLYCAINCEPLEVSFTEWSASLLKTSVGWWRYVARGNASSHIKVCRPHLSLRSAILNPTKTAWLLLTNAVLPHHVTRLFFNFFLNSSSSILKVQII